ncbi:MAG: hypothetical protein ABJA67_15220 [Chthonomonadales bacterium]
MSSENPPQPKTLKSQKSRFARLNKTKLAAVIFLLFTLAAMYGIYIVVFQPFAAISFDRPLWLKSSSGGLENNQRRFMVDDIFNKYIKPGASQNNVKGLLGEPESIISQDPETHNDLNYSDPRSISEYKYLIGQQFFGVDWNWLNIKFDHNRKYLDWYISFH